MSATSLTRSLAGQSVGVTLVQEFPVGKRTGPATIQLLVDRISALGAVQVPGHFLVECSMFSSIPELGSKKYLYVMHHSDYPATVFPIAQAEKKLIPLVTENMFDFLMRKMSAFYPQHKLAKVECTGLCYELVDFYIKIGSVTINSNFKGVLVEVQYRACDVPNECWNLLKEFMVGFMEKIEERVWAESENYYQPVDTMLQYYYYFRLYRARQNASSAPADRQEERIIPSELDLHSL